MGTIHSLKDWRWWHDDEHDFCLDSYCSSGSYDFTEAFAWENQLENNQT